MDTLITKADLASFNQEIDELKMIIDNSAIGFSISQKDNDLILAIFPYDLPDDCGEDDFIYASLKEACLEEIDSNKTLDGKIPEDGCLRLKDISKKFRSLAKIIDKEIENNREIDRGVIVTH